MSQPGTAHSRLPENARSPVDVDLDGTTPAVVTGHIVCPRCGKRGDTEKGLRSHLVVVHAAVPMEVLSK